MEDFKKEELSDEQKVHSDGSGNINQSNELQGSKSGTELTLNLKESPSEPTAYPTKSPEKLKKSPSPSAIPVPCTPPVTPTAFEDDDFDEDDEDLSIRSYNSLASYQSSISSCSRPFVARNGTTFSGRKMKYIVHCSSYAGQTGDDYLTPTQRAQRHIRRLKVLLSQAKADLEQRDGEILRLTKEVVELRLFKASLSSPEEPSNSSDAVTVRENNDLKTSQDVSPIIDMTDSCSKAIPIQSQLLLSHHSEMIQSEMQNSFADSGHFDDITTSSNHSKDSLVQTQDQACGTDHVDSHRRELIELYAKHIEQLIQKHNVELLEDGKMYNDRVEAILQKLARSNERYADMLPDYEQAKDRIRDLEKQLENLQQKLNEHEDKHNKMYLQTYVQNKIAVSPPKQENVSGNQISPARFSLVELMHQLQVTQNQLDNIRDMQYHQERGNSQVLLSAKEAVSLWLLGARKTMYRRLIDAQQSKKNVDPEVTLQFLKSAIYYFLTDKENTQGHLNAIESILGFSDIERINISKARND